MALKREVLIANAALAALTPEQITAIETLSANDENTVIGTRIGEVYRELDTTIKTVTGLDRAGDEKTYKYLERAATTLKDKAAEAANFKKQADDLAKEKLRLEAVIAEGSTDAESKKQLDQAKRDLVAVQNQYNGLKTDFDKAKGEHEKSLFDVQVKSDLTFATTGVKFKKDLPPAVTSVILDQVLSKVKSSTPEYIDNGKGGKMLVFKDETGAIMRNPENQLNPYTAAELVQKELKGLQVLDEGRDQKGGGTNPNEKGGGGGGGGSIDLSGAKTRVEANTIISKSLMAQGLVVGSKEFDDASTAAWKENNVTELPES